MEFLASCLTRSLSREGRVILRGVTALLVLSLMLYFLNTLRLGYFGALSGAVNDGEITAENAVE